jgi:acetyl esterase/lipase
MQSAGGHLTALTALHLLAHADPKFSTFQLKGLVLHFGAFDMAKTPSYYNVKDDPVLNQRIMDEFLVRLPISPFVFHSGNLSLFRAFLLTHPS